MHYSSRTLLLNSERHDEFHFSELKRGLIKALSCLHSLMFFVCALKINPNEESYLFEYILFQFSFSGCILDSDNTCRILPPYLNPVYSLLPLKLLNINEILRCVSNTQHLLNSRRALNFNPKPKRSPTLLLSLILSLKKHKQKTRIQS